MTAARPTGGHARGHLEAALDELAARRDEVARLEREIEETNRGVVALYAELDAQTQRLREADAAKSRFLSAISHELRTPLNSILALSRLLLEKTDGPLTAEQERQVDYVRRAAEDLSGLVNELLDLARIEAGRVQLYAGPVAVEPLFRSLRGMLRPLRRDETCELVFEVDADLPELQTDEGRLAQILRNLVSNALKFTAQGEVRVRASADPDPGWVRFTVTDTGVGIAAHDLERIFEEFVQIEGAHQVGLRGTGLGLPLSRRLAALLGGGLTVESELGRGSTFTLRMPAVLPVAAADEAPRGRRGATLPAAAPASAPRTALVVDDDEIARYLARGLLAELGCVVVEAPGGVSGLARATELRPDLIVLDLQMPDMDGFEVLARLRADPATAAIPVVVRTSRQLNADDLAAIGHVAAIVGKDGADRAEATARLREILAGLPRGAERGTPRPEMPEARRV